MKVASGGGTLPKPASIKAEAYSERFLPKSVRGLPFWPEMIVLSHPWTPIGLCVVVILWISNITIPIYGTTTRSNAIFFVHVLNQLFLDGCGIWKAKTSICRKVNFRHRCYLLAYRTDTFNPLRNWHVEPSLIQWDSVCMFHDYICPLIWQLCIEAADGHRESALLHNCSMLNSTRRASRCSPSRRSHRPEVCSNGLLWMTSSFSQYQNKSKTHGAFTLSRLTPWVRHMAGEAIHLSAHRAP